MPTITQLLHRRTDLSTFLVHLTRSYGGSTARANLLSILKSLRIEARSKFGPAGGLGNLDPDSQKAVCFTETPLEHTWTILEELENPRRQVELDAYGLVITKTTARRAGCNPVWYTDMTPGTGRDWLVKSVNDLIEQAREVATSDEGVFDAAAFAQNPIFKLTPFFEQMGKPRDILKEFWWEREWRHAGDFPLSFPGRVVAILAPADDHDALRAEIGALDWVGAQWVARPLLDPRWGLERMIVALAGIEATEIGPFPSHG
ncbi:hypothetical protein [Actinoplanes sp. L3-i22]|uniref:hypothetical protein n=1 Tax=Actinoplanes sp. L3-i22 TaxID=2836373 RepID=UPI001C788994|nr:hypothetical protein [Actinoplanes sp. L3-i22]BCY11129.1 hypothetical protein L3i22_062170 [Actinoplanes sp. L3-i22]